MSRSPFFSVIIPTYNRAHLLGETISSVLAQDYGNFELLVIDDGSTDNTEQLIKTIQDHRIHYFKKENGERGAARNYGLKRAKGNYALFFDSDDWMYTNHLSTLHKYVSQSGANYQFIATKHQLQQPDGTVLAGGTDGCQSRWYTLDDLLKGNIFACHFAVNTGNKSLQYFEEDRQYAIMEDWMFLLSNLQYHPIYLTPEITISFRQHEGRSMADNQKVIAARRRATDWIKHRIPLSVQQKKILQGYSHYFCAIHFYLDKNKTESIWEAKASWQAGGPKKALLALLLKTVVGRTWIEKIKR